MSRRSKRRSPRDTGSPPQIGPRAGQVGNAVPPVVLPSDRWGPVLICVLLALAVWIVFGQTRHHEFGNYDDQEYVYRNSIISPGLNLKGITWAFTRLHNRNWHPLTTISHMLMLDCQLYGMNAGGHHLTNVLPYVHKNLGSVLLRQGKMAEATSHFERALQLKPNDAEAHANWGHALAAEGKLTEARQHFQQAMSLAAARGNAALAQGLRNWLEQYQPPSLHAP